MGNDGAWIVKASLLMLLVIAMPLFVLAANDPGHDTLYIEEVGDSELVGALNISTNFSVEGGRTYQGSRLTLYGDGSIPSPVEAYISGDDSSNLYLEGQGNIYLKYYGSDTVYVGRAGITATDLNVSGALYIQSGVATINGQPICLANGSNCPSALGGANITGSGSAGYLAQWQNANTLNSSVIYQDGGDIVLNGTLGPELAPALTAGNWNLTAEWRYVTSPSNKIEKYADGNGNATPNISMGIEVGKTYRVEITSSEMPISWNEFRLGGASGEVMDDVGTYVSYITAVTTENLYLFTSRINVPRYNISSVSVRELIGGDATVNELAVRGKSIFWGRIGMGTSAPEGQLHVINGGNVFKEVNIRFGSYGSLGQTDMGTAWGGVDKGLIMGNNAYGGTLGYRVIYNTSAYGYRALTMDKDGIYMYSITGATTENALLSSSAIRMAVLNTGYVGIGTSSPTQKLHVAGSVNISGSSKLYSPEVCIAGDCKTAWPTSSVGSLSGGGSAKYIPVWNSTEGLNNSEIYQLDANIGIGTTAPTQKLDVNGNLNISSSAGTLYTTSINTSGATNLTLDSFGGYVIINIG